jgi:hypothetical protein
MDYDIFGGITPPFLNPPLFSTKEEDFLFPNFNDKQHLFSN